MKRLLYVGIMVILITSCTKSQFVSLHSNALPAPNGSYVYENDTVKISYSFKGDDGPIIISVYNKLSVPLYVDWTRSATVLNHKTLVFQAEGTSFTANTETVDIDWGYVHDGSATTNGTIARPNDMTFIAPNSMIIDDRKTIKGTFFDISSKARKSKKTVYTANGPVMVNLYKYQREDSPYSFRVYLTIVTDDKSSKPMHIDSEFWVSEIAQCGDMSKAYPLKENEFRITKATGFTATVTTVALVGTLTALTLIKTDDCCN